MTRKSLAALVVLGALLIAGCGSSNSSSDSSSAPTGNPVDRAFVAQMIPHHQSAIQMATIAKRRATDAFVMRLADNIVGTQTAEIATMRSADKRLKAAGVKQGSLGVAQHMTGMDGDVSSLNTAKPFDAAFMRMMLPHHQGAVVMARAELKKGKDPALKTLARNIISAQQREISQMRKHLASTGSTGKMGMHGAGHSVLGSVSYQVVGLMR
jgi:uncharacterized protein (DUF305 family)